MDKIKNQLAGVAALLGVIAAIGGGFVKYGEVMTKLEVLEAKESAEESSSKEEESSSESTETEETSNEGDTKQEKSVQSEKRKTVALKDILEKIDDKVKDIDKNMQLKNLVKLKIMSGDNILEAYNIPFYKPKDIYLDQVDMTDNRVIYTNELTEYKQSDPIFIQNQQINIILQERQKLIQELEVLQNG